MLNTLRKYKATYQLYNFFKKDQLVHNLPLYKKYGLQKKYYSSISSEDFKNIESPKNKYDQVDSAQELQNDSNFKALPETHQQGIVNWSKDGYAIIKGFFSEEEIDSFNNEINKLIDSNEANWRYQNKIMFAIHKSKTLYNAGSNSKLLNVLSTLMGKKVSLFQSINFLTASEQRAHSDSIHMSTFPYGNLIAVWVALEDIKENSGPLHYYPGSHKLPYVMNADFGNVGTNAKLGDKDYNDYEDKIEEVINSNQLKKEIFLPEKGDILIWHANLLHGGEPKSDPDSTRKSMVFHYYAEDAICYHEVTQRPTLKKK